MTLRAAHLRDKTLIKNPSTKQLSQKKQRHQRETVK